MVGIIKSDYSVLLVSDREGFREIFSCVSPRIGYADTIDSVFSQCGGYAAVLVDCDSKLSGSVLMGTTKIDRPVVYVIGKNREFLGYRVTRAESCVVFDGNVGVVKKHIKYACDSVAYKKTLEKLLERETERISKNSLEGGVMIKEKTLQAPTVDSVRDIAVLLTYDGSPVTFIEKSVHIISRILNTNKVAVLTPNHNEGGGVSTWTVANAIGFEGEKINFTYSNNTDSLCGALFRYNKTVTTKELYNAGELSECGIYELDRCFGAEVFVPVLSIDGPMAIIILGQRLNGISYDNSDIDFICNLVPYFVKTFYRLTQKENLIRSGRLMSKIVAELPHGVLITRGVNVVVYNDAFTKAVNVVNIETSLRGLGSKVSNFVLNEKVETEVFGEKKYKINRKQLPSEEQLFVLTEIPTYNPSVN